MKLRLLIPLLFLLTLSFGYMDLVKIKIDSQNDAAILDQMGIIINGIDGNELIAEIDQSQKVELRNMGYEINVITENINLVYQRNFDYGRYLTYNEYVDTMRIIAQNNPNICKLDTLGQTATGLYVLAMKISDNPSVNEPEPRVFFEADIHGDEKCGWACAYEMIKYLVRNYGSNTLVTNLVNTREIWICPMVNPYGYVNSRRYNSRNVDLNRNWGYMWRNTSGSAPFSEEETRALRKAFSRDAYSMWMSYHGGAVVTLYPWGFHTDVPLDNSEFDYVSASYARATNNRYGRIIVVMYYAPGSSCDHLFGAEGILAIGAEVHSIKTPPASEIDPLFNRNRDPMLDLMRYAKWGVEGLITDSVTGQPIPKAMIEPITPARWVSYNDSPNGDYHRFLRPGTYTLRFSANGYISKTVSGIVVPADTSVIVSVRLVPNPAQRAAAHKFVVCNVTDPTRAYANHSLSFWALGLSDSRRLSIGVAGWADFDMGTPIINRAGNDFVVVEGDADAERCTVLVANNWNGPWTRLGIANGTTEFDLQSGGMSQARYVRLRDDGDGVGSSPTAGFDVDAIEVYPLVGVSEQPLPVITKTLRPKLSVTPNPARTKIVFHIDNVDPADFSLSVFNCSGQRVWDYLVRNNNTVLNLCWDRRDHRGKPLPAGIYFVKLNCGNNSVTEKILLID